MSEPFLFPSQIDDQPKAETPAAPVEAGMGTGFDFAPTAGERQKPEFKFPSQMDEVNGPTLGTTAAAPFVGFNRGVANTIGAPVDIVNWGMGKLGLPVSEKPFGGSESIKSGMGYLGANPDEHAPRSTTEKYLQAAGEGAGSMVGGELAAAPIVSRLAATAPKTAAAIGTVFGRGDSAAASATNAAVGATGSMAGEASAEIAPEKYKPLARMAGTIAGGAPVAAGSVGARAAKDAIAPKVGEFLEPFTKAGQEAAAARQFKGLFSDAPAAADGLNQAAEFRDTVAPGRAMGEVVPGSKPTTPQLTGDKGALSLEREMATANPEKFNENTAGTGAEQQNKARVDALGGIEPAGRPEDVSGFLNKRLAEIDAEHNAAVNAATQGAQGRASDIGSGRPPEVVGNDLRTRLQDAEQATRANERALWKAVDPEGKLALPASPVSKAAGEIAEQQSALAKPMDGEERAIFQAASNLPPVIPFNDMTALRSRVSTEMRNELRSAGNTPTFARLTQLRGAIESAITGAVENEARVDAAAAARGYTHPQGALADRLAASAPQTGSAVYTPAGRRVDVKYGVVDAGDLTGSHGPDMQPNPAFPPELQPRDRTRAASTTQIAQMAGNLQPERLGASASAMEGAPIIGPDRLVESGNARVLAVRKAYQDNGPAAQSYRDFLERQGYDTRGMAEPVLVRHRLTPMSAEDRVRFAQEANASPGLAMSASERAASDARRISDDMLAQYKGGDVASAQNRDFTRSFIKNVAERGEEGSFGTAEGTLSLEGEQRMRNALLHAAYENSGIVSSLAETGDENIRTFGNVLTDVAGEVAKVKRGIAAGQIDPRADIGAPMLEAARVVQNARSRGIKIADAMAQQDAFSQVSPVAEQILRLAYGQNFAGRLSQAKLADALAFASREAAQQTTEGRLFGEPSSALDILASEQVGKRANATRSPSRPSTARQSSAPQGPGQGGGAGGAEAPRPVNGQAGPGNAGGSPEVIERPRVTPNFTPEAGQRLNAATAATKDRAQTFGQGPVGQVLKTQGSRDNFRMGDASVPGALVRKGPGGFEASEAYRRAVNGDPLAMDAFHDAAAESLRRDAMTKDGMIDPAKFERWQAAHADMLRGLPDKLQAKFKDAAAATQAVADAAAARKQALDTYQAGILGKVMGVSDPADVTKTIGGILGAKDGVMQMRRLATEAAKNPDAAAGLRRAVMDSIIAKSKSATNVGSSGIEGIKPDTFKKLVFQNENVLKAAGFNPQEIGTLHAIAADIARSQQTLGATRLPGQSNTAADLLAHMKRQGEAKESLWGKLWKASVVGGEGGGPKGSIAAMGGVLGQHTVSMFRDAGMKTIMNLVEEGIRNPEVGRLLLQPVPKVPNAGSAITLRNVFGRLSQFVAEKSARTTPDIPERASGGRVNKRDYPAKRASHLEKQANRIRKAYGGELEPLMRIPDHVVAQALRTT